MDAVETKTMVLAIPIELYEGLQFYAHKDSDIKFLMITGIGDYLSKRQARTRRAERQKKGER